MQVFLFDKAYGRAHGFRPLGLGSILLFSLGSTLIFVALFFLSFSLGDAAPFLAILLSLLFLTIVFLYSFLFARPRSLAQQTAYIQDASGLIWQVTLWPQQFGSSSYQIARKQAGLGPGTRADQFCYYVQAAQQGISHWNTFWGGEEKVTPLYQLKVISQNHNSYQCTYLTSSGKMKSFSLPKAYPTLFHAFWGSC